MMKRHSRLLMRGALLVVAGVLLGGLAANRARAEDGKPLYEKNCVMCHGAGGKGDGPAGKMLKPPPGDLATVLKGTSDADIAKVIKEGGKAVGKAASMPAYGSKLSDDQIQSVVQYIKGLSSK
jgi:mono/diheme cytochrome c family protein